MRDITLTNNIGKTFDRVQNNRNKSKIQIIDGQAGDKTGRATKDHLLILNTVIDKTKEKNPNSYIYNS